jgi:Flp pilus assembly protein TadD
VKADDAGIYMGRGIARQAKKEFNEALADYSKAIELDPILAQAYANRAVIETLQNKKVDAARDFDKAFKLDPALKSSFREFIERRLNP